MYMAKLFSVISVSYDSNHIYYSHNIYIYYSRNICDNRVIFDNCVICDNRVIFDNCV